MKGGGSHADLGPDLGLDAADTEDGGGGLTAGLRGGDDSGWFTLTGLRGDQLNDGRSLRNTFPLQSQHTACKQSFICLVEVSYFKSLKDYIKFILTPDMF